MKNFDWSDQKNAQVKEERGISFEEVLFWIGNGGLLDIVKHPAEKFSHQEIFIVEIDNYAYLVPYVEDDEKIFLKTIIPSRKATKKYLK